MGSNPPFGSWQEPAGEPRRWLPVAIGALVVALVVAGAIVFGRGHGAQATGPDIRPAAPYAAHLPLTDVKMSQAENFAGGNVTYVEGRVANTGDRTVTGATVQMVFQNSLGQPAQVERQPLYLIRTRVPYVDTMPLGASPLKPGQSAEFRLTLEHVTPDWNGAYPELRVTQVDTQ